ncbi:gamma carbonic anhydrase family protein [Magnetovirga frankeli]|uniref:gamma carbonic anhydrase family protein n=1 Tax=Magnetovirga frankeli TaxID=947516 RepID=UPI0012940FA5|nr:gamma carbonic anhydrase family protein [gamma proteobacterium SS-5]
MNSIRPFQGHHPQIDPSAWIDPSAVVIGDVVIGPGSTVWPLCVIRGDIHRIRIGSDSNIQDGSVLHVTHASEHNPEGHPLEIGDRVTVGHRVTLHGCRIEGRALIGMGSTVLDGAVIEPEVYIGANSLVPPGKRLTGGHLWLGSPVKCVRPLSEQERQYLDYSAENYRKLAQLHAT